MAEKHPARALNVVVRVEKMCDFIEAPVIKQAVEQAVPVCMPRLPGALGFDIPLWVGLGLVGLWAALDAFSERAGLAGSKCPTCGRQCVPVRFSPYVQGDEGLSLQELEDLRHLYAHNYAGQADDEYFGDRFKRHVLKPAVAVQLTCGATFNGLDAQLNLPHLRAYSRVVQTVLERYITVSTDRVAQSGGVT